MVGLQTVTTLHHQAGWPLYVGCLLPSIVMQVGLRMWDFCCPPLYSVGLVGLPMWDFRYRAIIRLVGLQTVITLHRQVRWPSYVGFLLPSIVLCWAGWPSDVGLPLSLHHQASRLADSHCPPLVGWLAFGCGTFGFVGTYLYSPVIESL